MAERGLKTLAKARRQARMWELIGRLLFMLALIVLGLWMVKHIYYILVVTFFPDWVANLRRVIAHPLLHDFVDAFDVLALLWQAVPPWQPELAVPTSRTWEAVFMGGVMAVCFIGVFLFTSAERRQAEVMEFYRKREREAWRQEVPGQATPDPWGLTAVIQQGVWHQYAAPPEPRSQRPLWIVGLGLIVTILGGIAVLIVQYWFFQSGK
jgi:hypothetical protein